MLSETCALIAALTGRSSERTCLVEQSEKFEVAGDCARFSPEGNVSLEQAVGLVTSAIVLCRERGIPKLLVNGIGLTGFYPPSAFERYWFNQEWAQKSGGLVAVSLHVRPEFLDSENFGSIVGQNAGLCISAFASEREAVEFLRRPNWT